MQISISELQVALHMTQVQ